MPEASQDVTEGDYHLTAGLRCQRLLAEDPRTVNVPIVIWDSFNEEDMQKMFGDTPSNVHFLTKASEYYTDDLARKVQAVILSHR